jgi:pentatricopeptide repeat protein
MIQAYGDTDQAEKATEILYEQINAGGLQSPPPDVNTFVKTIEAWTRSTNTLDRAERALEVFQMMKDCEVRPNIAAYNKMMKCLSTCSKRGTGETVDRLLNDIRIRDLEPDASTLNYAIKACLACRDVDRAENILEEMETSGTPPDIYTYGLLLNHLAELCTRRSAERAEQIMSMLHVLAEELQPALKPTATIYSIVLKAWSKSGVPDAAEQMWRVYGQMQEHHIEPCAYCCTTMINFFTDPKQRDDQNQWMERAEEVLNVMVSSDAMTADYRQFQRVVEGWLAVGEAHRALNVFMQRIDSYVRDKNLGLRPIRGNFHIIAKALVREGDLVAATEFVDRMHRWHVKEKQLPVGPEVQTIQMLLTAWEEMKDPLNGQQERDDVIAKLKCTLNEVTNVVGMGKKNSYQ